MIQEIEAKSLLRKHGRVDSWFLSAAGMNLYRGCFHACAYCDGRAEKYQVPGEFGVDIGVKVNATSLLQRELDPSRKRVPLRPGYLCLGGGVGDSYQPVEEQYQLARKVLEIAVEYKRPVHILTKSSLVERDFDILEKINIQNQAMLSMSFSTVDDEIAQWLEPHASPPSLRLATLAKAKTKGLAIGMYLMPVIPGITDSPGMIEDCITRAKAVGIDFIMFGGLTLKTGRQKEYFLRILAEHAEKQVDFCAALYPDSPWGAATSGYYEKISAGFWCLAKKHRISSRIPPRLYKHMLGENDRLLVMLEHLDYLMRLEGKHFSCWPAIRKIETLATPISQWDELPHFLERMNPAAQRSIQEIISTGTHAYLESMLA